MMAARSASVTNATISVFQGVGGELSVAVGVLQPLVHERPVHLSVADWGL